MTVRKNSALGMGLLLLAAVIWGTAFVAQSVGMDYLSPCTFNAARNFIGSAALLPAALISSKIERKKKIVRTPKILIFSGALCGVLLGIGGLLQQTGIKTVSAGKAGFLTALYIVLVPFLGVFFGRKLNVKIIISALLALMGLWLLSVQGDFAIASGDILIILCAFFFAFHILVVDKYAPYVNGVALSSIQFFVAGIVSAIATAIFEKPTLSQLISAWVPLVYAGVFSSGVAYTLQILGQKAVAPATASIILSLESVFAAIAGWIILKEPMSVREIFGALLMFAGVVLTQLHSRQKNVLSAQIDSNEDENKQQSERGNFS